MERSCYVRETRLTWERAELKQLTGIDNKAHVAAGGSLEGVTIQSSGRVVVQPSTSLPPTLRFGVFELDPRAGELRKRGMKIRLQGQPLDIPVMLLQCPGETVSREELQKKLWPADTFVDFEQGLNNAMKRLRLYPARIAAVVALRFGSESRARTNNSCMVVSDMASAYAGCTRNGAITYSSPLLGCGAHAAAIMAGPPPCDR